MTARNPYEQKLVQPSSSRKIWSAYVGLHNMFEFHLKVRCTVELQAPFFPGKVWLPWQNCENVEILYIFLNLGYYLDREWKLKLFIYI